MQDQGVGAQVGKKEWLTSATAGAAAAAVVAMQAAAKPPRILNVDLSIAACPARASARPDEYLQERPESRETERERKGLWSDAAIAR